MIAKKNRFQKYPIIKLNYQFSVKYKLFDTHIQLNKFSRSNNGAENFKCIHQALICQWYSKQWKFKIRFALLFSTSSSNNKIFETVFVNVFWMKPKFKMYSSHSTKPAQINEKHYQDIINLILLVVDRWIIFLLAVSTFSYVSVTLWKFRNKLFNKHISNG